MRKDIQIEVGRVVKEIRLRAPEARIYLFGSALNEMAEHVRDLDFLIVVPDSLPLKALRRKIITEVPRQAFALDLLVVPEDFFADKVRQGGNFYAFIAEEGVILNEAA